MLEDFIGENMETIFVSTIHKAKGREFDNVFLMLDLFDPGTNEAKRQLYVAMTRAKHNLTLYDNGNYLNSIKAEDMQVVVDSQTYLPPQELVMQLSHRDVQLDFFLYCRHLIKDLNSGECLSLHLAGNLIDSVKGFYAEHFFKQRGSGDGYPESYKKIAYVIRCQGFSQDYILENIRNAVNTSAI